MMVAIKISDEWLRDKFQDEFSEAVHYGVRRAYKHSDATPPSDSQVEAIIAEVHTAIDKVLAWDEKNE
jgi:hypothetical protein